MDMQIPPSDWNADFAATVELQQRMESSKGDFPRAFAEMFQRKYQNPQVRRYRRTRIEAALKWFESHASEIESAYPDYVVIGGSGGLLAQPIVTALYAIYCNCPEEHVRDDFPVDALADFFDS